MLSDELAPKRRTSVRTALILAVSVLALSFGAVAYLWRQWFRGCMQLAPARSVAFTESDWRSLSRFKSGTLNRGRTTNNP